MISALAPTPAFSEEMGVIVPTGPSHFPNIHYMDEKKEPLELHKDLGAKLTIVHFWATWCVPCVGELPVVDQLQAKYASKGLKVISISEDGVSKAGKVREFFAQHNITTLPSYFDFGQKNLQDTKARGLPTSFIVDAQGNQIAIVEGPIDWAGKDATGYIESHLK